MKSRLLTGLAGTLLVTAGTTALAAPGPSIVQQLSHDPAVRQKAAHGLPLVFGPRPSIDPSRTALPARSEAAVAVRLSGPADDAALAKLHDSGLQIARRADGSARTIARSGGHTVLGHATATAIIALAQLPEVKRIGLDGAPLGLLPPMDVTAAEVGAPDVWRSYDNADRPITGEGIKVCDSDSGADIFHPSFFFADGGHYVWIDNDDNGVFDIAVDGVDFDGDGTAEPLSVLNSLISGYFDPEPLFGSGDPSFQLGLDWLYWDQNGNGVRDLGREAGFDDSSPGFGELLLTFDDVNGNGSLDLGEKLVALGSSKVATAYYNGQTYQRGVNLIDLPREEGIAHGTSSAAVIAGGHLGLSDKVGIAPGAELIIAARTELDGDLLQLADFCLENGARVMLHEYAPWVGYHVDGSSDMEALIDQSSAGGVAHINPAGNLSTSKKLYKHQLPAGQTTTIDFIADSGGPYVALIGTLLWREPNRPITVVLEDPNGNTLQMPDSGMIFEPLGNSPYSAYGERETSDRGTVMVTFYVFENSNNPSPLPSGTYQMHVTDGDPTAGPLEMIAYVQDDRSGWGEGIRFDDAFVSEDHLIGWPGTADLGIAIAAYTGTGHRSGTPGERASYSGRGYRIDGQDILSLSAPADPVVAGYFPDGEARYTIYGGTSGASPHVAGAAALLIQANPDLTGEQVRQALRGGALADSAVGAIPNHDWGYGKLRIFNSLYGASPAPNSAPDIKGFDAEVMAGEPAAFAITASDPEDAPETLRIDIDQDYDGNWDSLAEEGLITVNFAEEGVYYSKLRVTDSGGLTDVTLAKFTVIAGSEQPPINEEPPDLTGRNCGCTLPGRSSGTPWPLLLGLPLLALGLRRKHH